MDEKEEMIEQEPETGMRWLWFVGGCALSFTTLCSIVLLLMLLASAGLNAYLAWTLSGYQVSIYRPGPASTAIVAAPTSMLAAVPTETPPPPILTPTPIPTATATQVEVEMKTPEPPAAEATLLTEFATLAAVATHAAEIEAASTPSGTPVVTLPEEAETSGTLPAEAGRSPGGSQSGSNETVTSEGSGGPVGVSASTNRYDLIPIEGERESRPAEEHGDLNLKLRDPQPVDLEATLIDIPGSGIDPDAPDFSAVFKPDFVRTYAIHDWDWGCNCKGKLIDDGSAVLVGIKTTPGEPIFIPKTDRDIYEGKYYAVVLYASEDSLTFVYARAGNVVNGYTVHYEGIQTDPNLLKLFQESKGNQLPGLTLDTPVGVAAGDEIIVAIRDNGTFLDARSRLDWWE
ncbi:MAG: hypothetical protein Kow0063_15870 [Anaerolineae bacterium]